MNKKYKAFKINFVSNDYDEKNRKGINGIAYYVINKSYKIIKQFIQIKNASFRPTDIEMLKTSYYNSKSECIKIRKKILEKIQKENSNLDPLKISKTEKIRLNIPNNYIQEINLELLKMNRVKKSIDIFRGSNSSGAESNNKATNIFSRDNNDKTIFDSMNFSNPLNSKKVYKNENISIDNLDELEIIPISEFIDKNKYVKELFFQYNQHIWELNKIDYLLSQKDIETFKEESIKVKWPKNTTMKQYRMDIKRYIDFNKSKIKEYSNEKISLIKNKLRNDQKTLISKEKELLLKKHKNKDKTFFNNFINNYHYQDCQHCHIIPVKKYSKDNIDKWFEIADNNNCLLLPPDIHNYLDKKRIAFDYNGNCINLHSNKIKENLTLKKEILNNERQKYLKRYFDEVLNKSGSQYSYEETSNKKEF